jgi:hypothetical protein
MTVEKLHTITNGFGERRLGEGGIEWLKIQLEGECIRAGIKKHENCNLFTKRSCIVEAVEITRMH